MVTRADLPAGATPSPRTRCPEEQPPPWQRTRRLAVGHSRRRPARPAITEERRDGDGGHFAPLRSTSMHRRRSPDATESPVRQYERSNMARGRPPWRRLGSRALPHPFPPSRRTFSKIHIMRISEKLGFIHPVTPAGLHSPFQAPARHQCSTPCTMASEAGDHHRGTNGG